MSRDGFDWPRETSLALRTRLAFVQAALDTARPATILDIGCGTGEMLTGYLAALNPGARVVGVDSDPASIAYAKTRFASAANLEFMESLPPGARFDAIVASEVVEHVDNPCAFLRELRRMLPDDGLLVLTVPNGYGCSEIMASLEALFHLSGVLPLLKRLKAAVFPAPGAEARSDTLALSPHINFFSLPRLRKVFASGGFAETRLQGRMFLHNFVFNNILDASESLARANAALGRRLPPALTSDWMFVLKKTTLAEDGPCPAYARNAYEKIKGALSRRRQFS